MKSVNYNSSRILLLLHYYIGMLLYYLKKIHVLRLEDQGVTMNDDLIPLKKLKKYHPYICLCSSARGSKGLQDLQYEKLSLFLFLLY